MASGAHDYVVQDFDLEQLPAPDEIPRYLDVRLGGCRLAAGMVVHDDKGSRRCDACRKNRPKPSL